VGDGGIDGDDEVERGYDGGGGGEVWIGRAGVFYRKSNVVDGDWRGQRDELFHLFCCWAELEGVEVDVWDGEDGQEGFERGGTAEIAFRLQVAFPD
jgi:hypothetical protein